VMGRKLVKWSPELWNRPEIQLMREQHQFLKCPAKPNRKSHLAMVILIEPKCLPCAQGVSVAPVGVEMPNELAHKPFRHPMALHMHGQTCNRKSARPCLKTHA